MRAGELACSPAPAAPAKTTLLTVGAVLLGVWLADVLMNDGRRSRQVQRYLS